MANFSYHKITKTKKIRYISKYNKNSFYPTFKRTVATKSIHTIEDFNNFRHTNIAPNSFWKYVDINEDVYLPKVIAEEKVNEACKNLLANQIMESYTFSLEEVK